MLRRPSLATPTAPSTGAEVLPRRGTHRVPAGGLRRRPTGRDVPVEPAGRPATAGVVPRMRRPRGAAEEPAANGVEVARPQADRPEQAARPTPLNACIDRHLALLRRDLPPLRPEAVDDDRARCDPPTASFAAIEIDAGPATGTPARVAAPGDRPRTAPFPAAATD